MDIDTRALLIFAIIGIIAGFIASLLLGGGGGILRYLITGFRSKIVSEIVTASVGAVIVVLLARFIA
jgi:uncharacterized membrane protein YeaQ/YmgE (transglycosylase-associated protein family)